MPPSASSGSPPASNARPAAFEADAPIARQPGPRPPTRCRETAGACRCAASLARTRRRETPGAWPYVPTDLLEQLHSRSHPFRDHPSTLDRAAKGRLAIGRKWGKSSVRTELESFLAAVGERFSLAPVGPAEAAVRRGPTLAPAKGASRQDENRRTSDHLRRPSSCPIIRRWSRSGSAPSRSHLSLGRREGRGGSSWPTTLAEPRERAPLPRFSVRNVSPPRPGAGGGCAPYAAPAAAAGPG